MKCLTRVCSRPTYASASPAMRSHRRVFSFDLRNRRPSVSQAGDRTRTRRWVFVMSPASQGPSVLALADSAPLLEEEWHACPPTLVADRHDPRLLHGSRAGTAFATNDHPVDAAQV